MSAGATAETAVQAVLTAINAANLTRGDGQPLVVTDFDPLPGELDLPAQVAVTFGGMSETDWHVLVRLYVSAAADVQAAEKYVRATVPAIDAALDNVPSPRTSWSKTWSEDFICYIADTALAVGREDF